MLSRICIKFGPFEQLLGEVPNLDLLCKHGFVSVLRKLGRKLKFDRVSLVILSLLVNVLKITGRNICELLIKTLGHQLGQSWVIFRDHLPFFFLVSERTVGVALKVCVGVQFRFRFFVQRKLFGAGRRPRKLLAHVAFDFGITALKINVFWLYYDRVLNCGQILLSFENSALQVVLRIDSTRFWCKGWNYSRASKSNTIDLFQRADHGLKRKFEIPSLIRVILGWRWGFLRPKHHGRLLHDDRLLKTLPISTLLFLPISQHAPRLTCRVWRGRLLTDPSSFLVMLILRLHHLLLGLSRLELLILLLMLSDKLNWHSIYYGRSSSWDCSSSCVWRCRTWYHDIGSRKRIVVGFLGVEWSTVVVVHALLTAHDRRQRLALILRGRSIYLVQWHILGSIQNGCVSARRLLSWLSWEMILRIRILLLLVGHEMVLVGVLLGWV